MSIPINFLKFVTRIIKLETPYMKKTQSSIPNKSNIER